MKNESLFQVSCHPLLSLLLTGNICYLATQKTIPGVILARWAQRAPVFKGKGKATSLTASLNGLDSEDSEDHGGDDGEDDIDSSDFEL